MAHLSNCDIIVASARAADDSDRANLHPEESILRSLGAGRFNAFSAGSHPKSVVNPLALKTIEAFGCSTEGLQSKNWDEFATPHAPKFDFAFTLCDDAAGETCPAWQGQPMTAHWGIEDPTVVEGANIEKERAFAQAFRYLRNRITVFIALPIKSLAHRAPARNRQDGRRYARPDDHEEHPPCLTGVALCIVAGVTLGQLLPGLFRALGAATVAEVNLPARDWSG